MWYGMIQVRNVSAHEEIKKGKGRNTFRGLAEAKQNGNIDRDPSPLLLGKLVGGIKVDSCINKSITYVINIH